MQERRHLLVRVLRYCEVCRRGRARKEGSMNINRLPALIKLLGKDFLVKDIPRGIWR